MGGGIFVSLHRATDELVTSSDATFFSVAQRPERNSGRFQLKVGGRGSRFSVAIEAGYGTIPDSASVRRTALPASLQIGGTILRHPPPNDR